MDSDEVRCHGEGMDGRANGEFDVVPGWGACIDCQRLIDVQVGRQAEPDRLVRV